MRRVFEPVASAALVTETHSPTPCCERDGALQGTVIDHW